MSSGKHRGVFERPPKSGIWWILYYDADGRRHREKVGRRSAAIEAYIQRKSEIRIGTFVSPSRKERISFRALAEMAMEHKKSRFPRSYHTDDLRLKPLLDEFGGMSAAAVNHQRIDDLLLKYHAGGKSGSTVNRYRSLLSSIFSFGLRTGRVDKNPCAGVTRYQENSPRVRFLQSDEEEAVRKTIQAKYPNTTREAELDIALHTGARRGEQYSLTWDKVDLDRMIVELNGKTGRRFVPINESCRMAFKRLHERSKGSPFVCPDRDPKAVNQKDFRDWLETCVEDAGVQNFTWHDLRHTFASRLVMAGVDIRTVQELLGHKSILMTMRYSHLSPDHKAAAVAKLAPAKAEPNVVTMGRKRAR